MRGLNLSARSTALECSSPQALEVSSTKMTSVYKYWRLKNLVMAWNIKTGHCLHHHTAIQLALPSITTKICTFECIRNWSCSSMTYRYYVKETTLENIKPQFVFQTLSLYPSANRQRTLNVTLYPVSRHKSLNLTAKRHKAANYRAGPPAETPLPIAQVSIYSRFFLDRY